MLASMVAAVIAAGVGMLQASLACGAPLGMYAWGGQVPGRLPTRLRVASAVTVPVYGVITLVALGAAGEGPLAPAPWLLWSLAGLFGLGSILNVLSRSRRERLVMTPVAAILTASFVMLAATLPTGAR